MKFGLVSIICLIGFFGFRSALSNMFSSTVATATKTGSCIALTGSTTNEQEGRTYIVGTVRNSCDHTIGSVTVTFKIDPRPGVAETGMEAIAYAYSRDVKAGETRKFKTMMSVAKDATFHFGGINSF
jgi:hypothetical protein